MGHLPDAPAAAAGLPFDAGAFDVVLCQAALMFFPDRSGALREMARVTSDGRLELPIRGHLVTARR